ncbi:hypothetical protein EDB83DRAFT_2317535 [Lactarius deliciosus]|nr:hypothetical protein EDB83DRAFT_2317535 [Lactarius deliciosus]
MSASRWQWRDGSTADRHDDHDDGRCLGQLEGYYSPGRSCSRAALHMTAMRKIGEGQGRVVKNLLHRPRIQYPRAGELHDLVTVAVGPTTPGGGRRRPDSGALESELHSCAGSMRSAGYRA